MAHVAKWKQREVEELTSILTSYPVVGVVEIGSIPAPQLQHMRAGIREIGVLRVTRNRLLLHALKKVENKVKGISALTESVKGQAAIIATESNPFKLFKYIKETKTNAPAKGGEIATYDIEVKAGETPFKPGPIVGELQKAGIPAAIEEGKVVIKKDKVVVSAGETIPPQLAQMLTRLEIYPIEIGMKLHAVFEDGNIFTPDALDIDAEKFMADIKQAAYNTFALAVSVAWVTPQTVESLIAKAHREAVALAVETAYPTKGNIKLLLAKAYAQSLALASKVDEHKNT
ncbi:MAG TPA: 50S ribosomal protein L10 [Thermoplasmata archaeon]|nr:50S ribosomal protein L10 [Thermoplasmata archaeon]